MECWSFLHFGHFSKDREKSDHKWSQDHPKSSQTEPKMAILALSWPILAATCCQLGPSCVHLGSIFAPTSPKISTRSRQKSQEGSPETPKPPRRSPEGSRTAPGTRIFMVWGSILDLILRFSCSLSFNSSGGLESGLLQTCDDSSLILKPSHPPRNPPILHGLPASSSRHVAAWRAQRIG